MAGDDPKATYLLDKLTETGVARARVYARAGLDILHLGDDVGMQDALMMSREMYREWLKPRLKRVIDAARAENPDLLVHYHSCGYVEPLIEDLIDVGIDILNPVQPECMDFERLHDQYGDRLSFDGTLGTQTTMPFGTPEEVRRTVIRNLDIAGPAGGLRACPTHVLEPEVPWENVEAYVQACKEYATAGA
jgi:uroporphyrinogen decarboxylase